MNDDADAPALRLPASEIEQSIRRATAKSFRVNANMRALAASRSADEKRRVFGAAEQLAADVEHLPASKASEVLNRLALRIVVKENEIEGVFEPATALGLADAEGTAIFKANFSIALDRQTYGHEARMRLQPSEPSRPVRNDRLVELLGGAFAAKEKLLEMDEEAAQSIKTSKLRHLQRLARLSYLDPTVIRSILKGTRPKSLSARSLWRMADFPIRYADQRVALGLPNS